MMDTEQKTRLRRESSRKTISMANMNIYFHPDRYVVILWRRICWFDVYFVATVGRTIPI
jgi:hypothetical protein